MLERGSAALATARPLLTLEKAIAECWDPEPDHGRLRRESEARKQRQ